MKEQPVQQPSVVTSLPTITPPSTLSTWFEQIKLFLNAPNFITGDQRLARAGIFLVIFSFVHAIPNGVILLPNGARVYDAKARDMQNLPFIEYAEVFLALSFVVHVLLAIRSMLSKPAEVRNASKMLWSGVFLLGFLCMHLVDFRFGGFKGPMLPFEFMRTRLGTWGKKYLYFVAVSASTYHAYAGCTAGLFYRLGFRGNVNALSVLARIVTCVSAGLYMIPIILVTPRPY